MCPEGWRDRSSESASRPLDGGTARCSTTRASSKNKTPDLHAQLRGTFGANTFGPCLLTDAVAVEGPAHRRCDQQPELYHSARRPELHGLVRRRGDGLLHGRVGAQYAYCVPKGPWGCEVRAFCSGYVLSNLGGPADREG